MDANIWLLLYKIILCSCITFHVYSQTDFPFVLSNFSFLLQGYYNKQRKQVQVHNTEIFLSLKFHNKMKLQRIYVLKPPKTLFTDSVP